MWICSPASVPAPHLARWLPFVLSHSLPPQTELTSEMAEANPCWEGPQPFFLGERQTHLAQADPSTAKRTKCRDANQYVSRTRGECTSSLKMDAAVQYGIGIQQLSHRHRLPLAQAPNAAHQVRSSSCCPQAPSLSHIHLAFLVTPS